MKRSHTKKPNNTINDMECKKSEVLTVVDMLPSALRFLRAVVVSFPSLYAADILKARSLLKAFELILILVLTGRIVITTW